MGGGWQAMNAIIRMGDLDRDGREDVIARESATGDLWFYPGTGTALGTRKRIGTGWNTMREITPVGDFTRDGYPDLLATKSSTGVLYLYPGRSGAVLGTRTAIGTDWNTMSELAGVGDFNRDGFTDLIARQTSTANLFLYPGRGTGLASRRQIGTGGWNGMRDLLGVGDFDRDGFTDLAAVNAADGNLYLYPGRGTALGSRFRLATGFGGRRPVF
jgi:hypothetical protein